MAIAKCVDHGQPLGTKRKYVKDVKPIGYPNPAVICNATNCEAPAMIWLDEDEARAYDNGQRLFFQALTGVLKIRVM